MVGICSVSVVRMRVWSPGVDITMLEPAGMGSRVHLLFFIRLESFAEAEGQKCGEQFDPDDPQDDVDDDVHVLAYCVHERSVAALLTENGTFFETEIIILKKNTNKFNTRKSNK